MEKAKKTADKRAYFPLWPTLKIHKPHFAAASTGLEVTCASSSERFPEVIVADIERFQSWDVELGWCNQFNVTKVDKSDRSANAKKMAGGLAIFSTDARGSVVAAIQMQIKV